MNEQELLAALASEDISNEALLLVRALLAEPGADRLRHIASALIQQRHNNGCDLPADRIVVDPDDVIIDGDDIRAIATDGCGNRVEMVA